MLYTESFKKQVVRKILSQGTVITEVGRKLNISPESIHRWKKQYQDEVRATVKETDLDAILQEEEVDVEALLRDADHQELEKQTGSNAVARHVEGLLTTTKAPSAFNNQDKFAIIKAVRALKQDKRGAFMRAYGLSDRHIQTWEDELIAMSKESITNDDYIRKLEEENKRLKKELASSERDKHELEVLIELKKKYHQLFKSEEDEK